VIRVWIDSPSPVTRAGLEALLRAEGGIELMTEEGHAEVVLTDAFDPEESHHQTVVALSDSPAQALRAGALAALPRDASPEQIAAAIHAAAAGLAAALPDDLQRALPASTGGLSEPLTPREVQVLRMIADGLGNKQIGWRLGISEHTVKFHVTSIMAKLHASSRTEAVAAGIRHGLVLI
jgi:DNA-binding CsgD family transcriptional regulator